MPKLKMATQWHRCQDLSVQEVSSPPTNCGFKVQLYPMQGRLICSMILLSMDSRRTKLSQRSFSRASSCITTILTMASFFMLPHDTVRWLKKERWSISSMMRCKTLMKVMELWLWWGKQMKSLKFHQIWMTVKMHQIFELRVFVSMMTMMTQLQSWGMYLQGMEQRSIGWTKALRGYCCQADIDTRGPYSSHHFGLLHPFPSGKRASGFLIPSKRTAESALRLMSLFLWRRNGTQICETMDRYRVDKACNNVPATCLQDVQLHKAHPKLL